MTATLDPAARPEADLEPAAGREALDGHDALDAVDVPDGETGPGGEGEGDEDAYAAPPLSTLVRPLAVAALSSGAAALMTGGIFGSWLARAIALLGALVGVAWAAVCIRFPARRIVLEALTVPMLLTLGVLSLVPTEEGPARTFGLMAEAFTSGRLLRPPVPFDPGWRPILLIFLGVIGFAAGWMAGGLKRPQMALLLPVPVLALTAISQPAEGEFIAALLGFPPLLVALGLLFGGDGRVSELGSAFEIKRAIRSLPLLAGGVVLLVLLSQTDFLFPKPVYDPTQKPQKPKSIPLGEVKDRVLFEIDSPQGITGPWKSGVLDFYDGSSWRLPPFDPKRLEKVGSDGVVDKTRTGDAQVSFTVGDIGNSASLPGIAAPTKIAVQGDQALLFDSRTGVFRVPVGRVPAGLKYTLSMPAYPTPEQLHDAVPPAKADPDLTYIPKPPPAVRDLLAQAPPTPFGRLQFLREKLNKVATAVGAGSPSQPVPVSKVQQLLGGNHEGSPFEIVAAEAMLARWAGFPSRIGFGFDQYNDENGKKTIRPKNGANWLEVQFEGIGWVPLVSAPPKAKASLDTDPNARFNENIVPSDDVAVELYIPVEVTNLKQLYEKVRAGILLVLPYVLGLAAAYLGAPSLRRALRRRKRRRWAHATGPRAEIAVEYCEFRDLASDLNVGDRHATPLEYLDHVAEDAEHAELAWLVTRATYGDLWGTVGDEDVVAAQDMAASLRRRMMRAQPFQSRVLAALSRSSLREPHTLEVPSVRQLRLPRLPRRTKRPSRRRSGAGPNRVTRRPRSLTLGRNR